MRASAPVFFLFVRLTCLAATRVWALDTAPGPAARAPARCASVRLAGDEAACTPARCTLTGRAELVCGDLSLRADAVAVDSDENHSFLRAAAQGNVHLTQANLRVDAEALVLNQDRISGRVENATVRLLRKPQVPPSEGVGTSALTAHGTLEREASGDVSLTDADVTLCDCGAFCLPTWRLVSPKVRISEGRRAVVFWPRLEINVAKRWMLPITPPLAYVSLPLARRAAGFLPPKFRFYGAGRPTVDLPFFFPLGPHADLTIAPGLRTDWAGPHSANLLGAPRLGVSLRYAPLVGTRGEMSVATTYDDRRTPKKAAPPRTRLRLDWRHESAVADDQEVTIVARWVADAGYLKDFGVRPTDRVAPYIASRGQWVYRGPRAISSLSLDALLPLDQGLAPFETGKAFVDPAQVPRRETMHRLPAWRATYLPRGRGISWAKGQLLHPAGELFAVHYGRLFTGPARDANANSLNVVGARMGGQTAGLWGPVATRMHASLDMLGVAAENVSFAGGVGGRAGAELTLRALGALGAWQHYVEPGLRLEAIVPIWGETRVGGAQAARGLDEHMRARQVQQAALSLRQQLTHANGLAIALNMAQPLDLRARTLLQPDVGASASLATRAALEGRVSLRPYVDRHAMLRETRLSGWVRLGWARVSGDYARVAPDTDRATRSIYELSAPGRPNQPTIEQADRWVHTATGKLMAQVSQRTEAPSQASYQLPRPGTRTTRDCPAKSRHCFVSHSLEARIDSACRCWGVTALVGVAPGNIAQTFRVQLGFTLGARAEDLWRGRAPAAWTR